MAGINDDLFVAPQQIDCPGFSFPTGWDAIDLRPRVSRGEASSELWKAMEKVALIVDLPSGTWIVDLPLIDTNITMEHHHL